MPAAQQVLNNRWAVASLAAGPRVAA